MFHEDPRAGSDPGEDAPRRWPYGYAADVRFHEGHGPHGRHCGPHGFGPHGRARRGNVKAAILAVLAEQPMHGYEVMQQLESRSGGMWRPSPGSIYPTLQLLEDQGLIKSEDVDGRRVFSLTDEGKTEAATITEQRRALGDLGERTRGRALQAARRRDAAHGRDQAGRHGRLAGADRQDPGDPREARKRIYGLLAESE